METPCFYGVMNHVFILTDGTIRRTLSAGTWTRYSVSWNESSNSVNNDGSRQYVI